jgi:hypothetical protein
VPLLQQLLHLQAGLCLSTTHALMPLPLLLLPSKVEDEAAAAAVSDAAIIAHALSSSSSGWSRLAAALFGFQSVEDALQGEPAEQHSSGSGKGLLACRLRVKALHQLLQQGLVLFQVVSTHEAIQQQQQQQVVAAEPAEAAAAAPLIISPAAGGAKKGAGSKRRRSSAASAAAVSAAVHVSGWVQLAVHLLPGFFFDTSNSSSTGQSLASSGSGSRTAAAEARVWSLQEPDAEAPSPAAAAAAAGDASKAVNCLVDMLIEGSLLQQQQRDSSSCEVHVDQKATHCEVEDDDDDELQQIIHHYQQQQQQQTMQPHQADHFHASSSAAAAAAAPTADTAAAAAAAAERFEPQFELLSCPDTAAAAGSDVRQSLFDWVNPAAWKLQAAQPPGLQCSMFRYQLRALAWMQWREQHGTEPLGSSSSSSSSGDDAAAAAAAGEAQCILGSQLLNPLWEEVQLAVAPHPAAAGVAAASAAAADSTCMCGGCGRSTAAASKQQQQQQCANKQQQQQQQQPVVLYRAVSHGLVSRQRPAGFCGPAGGVLCDEMGLGKTVEVRAWLHCCVGLLTAGADVSCVCCCSDCSGQVLQQVLHGTFQTLYAFSKHQWVCGQQVIMMLSDRGCVQDGAVLCC